MNTNIEFVKSAAQYSQQAAQVVEAAYAAMQEINDQRTKTAEVAPKTVSVLSSLAKANGQPFVPEGFEKQAAEMLTNQPDTLKILGHVLAEYGKLKEAHDRQVPALGTVAGTKTAAERRPISFDTPESKAMARFTDLLAGPG